MQTVSAPPTGVRQAGVVSGAIIVAVVSGLFLLVHTSVFPTFPIYYSLRGAKETDVSLVIGIMGVVSLISRPLSGWLIDRWGRVRMVQVPMIVLCLVSLGYGMVGSLIGLAILRIINGTSVGIMITSSTTYVSDIAPPARRAEFLGYLAAVQTAASSLGPTLGYLMLGLTIPAWLLSFVFWWPDLQTGDLASLEFTSLFLAMMALTAFGAVLTLFAKEPPRVATWQPTGINMFVHRKAIVPMLLLALVSVPFSASISFVPFFARDHGLENVGLYFTVQAIGGLLAGVALGRVADRFGRKPVIVIGLLGSGLAMLLLASASVGAAVLAAGTLSGFFMGGAESSLNALTSDRVPQSERGAALSTVAAGFDLGLSFGALMVGFVVPLAGIAAGFVAAGALAIVGGVVAIVVLRESARAETVHAAPS